MKIIAIDPGYDRLGIAILDKEGSQKETLVYSECFKTSKELDFEERLFLVGEKVEEIIKEYDPEYLAIEKVYFTSNRKSAMSVSEVRGAIKYIAKKSGLEIFEINPNQIKSSISGYGNAKKAQMMLVIPKLIKINKEIKSDDEFDAIAAGMTFFAYFRYTQARKI